MQTSSSNAHHWVLNGISANLLPDQHDVNYAAAQPGGWISQSEYIIAMKPKDYSHDCTRVG